MIFLDRSDSKLMESQIFSQLIVDFFFHFGPNFLLPLLYDGFGVRVLSGTVLPPKPWCFFDEIEDGLSNI